MKWIAFRVSAFHHTTSGRRSVEAMWSR